MRSHWRVASVFLSAISLLGLATGTAGAQSPQKSQQVKPHGTLPEKLALLTTQELTEIPEAPTSIKAVPTGHGITLFTPSGDQKGPCGLAIKIHVDRKTIAGGAGREFKSDSLSGYQYVLDLPGMEATQFLTAWQKQLHPGCPAYKSTNPYGQIQTTQLLSVLAIPSDVDQAAGSLERVDTGESSVGIYTFAFRMGRRIEMLALFVPQPLSQTFGDGLVSLAESRLRASEGSVA